MGKVSHLSVESLSALLDGELGPLTEREGRAHLAECPECSAELAAFARLDAQLSEPPLLTCGDAIELRSAHFDRELSAAEAAIAVAHLAGCERCGSDQAAWSGVEAVLRAMPRAYPAARIDAAMAKLIAAVPAPRVAWPNGLATLADALFGSRSGISPGPARAVAALRMLAVRGAVVAALVLALLVALVPGQTGEPGQLGRPAPEEALVAAAQEVVLHPRNNTLYVLQSAAAAVDAMDATSYALRTRIVVGGRPTALALSEATNRVLVLDAGLKALLEIDPDRNAVVSSTPIDVSGTPTSLQVDQANGKILVVATVPEPAGEPRAARATAPGGPQIVPTTPEPRPALAGQVAIIDSFTKKLETIRAVEVAPRLVVPDPNGKQSLLVSSDATAVVDASYRTLRTLPGGVSAAFDASGKTIAVLSAQAGAATLFFIGDGAPAPLHLAGAPLAITPLPEGGFAVLVGSGGGNGRIHVVDGAGRAVAHTDIGLAGRDLAYDAAAKRFTVAAGGKVASAPLPTELAAASPTPDEGQRAGAPTLTNAPAAASPPPASPSPFASPSAASSPAPSPSATGRPVATAPEPSPSAKPAAIVPDGAQQVATDLYRFKLADGRVPVLTAATLKHLWFVDQRGGLNSMDMASGGILTFATFPRDADPSAIAVGPTHVYVADTRSARLFSLDLATERMSSRPLAFLRLVTDMTVAPDGLLWVGRVDSGQLLSIDPRTGRIEAVDTGSPGVLAIAVDSSARLWFLSSDGRLGSYDFRSGRVTLFAIPSRGLAHTLLPDHAGRVWVGTTAGEVLMLADGTALRAAVTVGGPVIRLTLDPFGLVWYLAPAPAGSSSYVYGLVNGGLPARTLPGPATSLDFNLSWRTWLAHPAGGFFLGVEAPPPP